MTEEGSTVTLTETTTTETKTPRTRTPQTYQLFQVLEVEAGSEESPDLSPVLTLLEERLESEPSLTLLVSLPHAPGTKDGATRNSILSKAKTAAKKNPLYAGKRLVVASYPEPQGPFPATTSVDAAAELARLRARVAELEAEKGATTT